jgi:dihydroneopterin aldolase
MDKIFFRRLSVMADIGILPWEKEHRQEIHIDLEFATDAAVAAVSDDINDAINYASVRETIISFVQNKRFNLLETLAEELSIQLIEVFSFTWLKLSISKPSIFDDADAVGICIER